MLIMLMITLIAIALFGVTALGALPAAAADFEPEVPEETAAPAYRRVVFTDRAMATEYQFILYAPRDDPKPVDLQAVAREAMAVVHDFEARFSRFRPDSQISRVNAGASVRPVRVAPDVFQLFQRAGRIHERTHGTFDITVGPIAQVWGLYRKEGRIPTEADRLEALSRVGFQRLTLDPENNTVAFEVPGMHVDFGGIAKGYALDEAAELLRRFGVKHGLLSAGTSTLVSLGPPPGSKHWTIRLRNPYNNGGFIELAATEGSMSTSGVYEKFVEIGGERYGHIVDPRTGKPVSGNVVSATAIAPSGAESDALSTAFFVLGLDEVAEYCNRHPGVQAVMVLAAENGEFVVHRINLGLTKEMS